MVAMPQNPMKLGEPDLIEAPEWFSQLLYELGEEIEAMVVDPDGERCYNPALNTASVYINDVFEMRAYDWREDGKERLPNFKWNDVEVYWYKWVGRDTEMNREVSLREAAQMFYECVESIWKGVGE